jgi:hypothetical protein
MGELLKDWAKIKDTISKETLPVLNPIDESIIEQIVVKICFMQQKIPTKSSEKRTPWPQIKPGPNSFWYSLVLRQWSYHGAQYYIHSLQTAQRKWNNSKFQLRLHFVSLFWLVLFMNRSNLIWWSQLMIFNSLKCHANRNLTRVMQNIHWNTWKWMHKKEVKVFNLKKHNPKSLNSTLRVKSSPFQLQSNHSFFAPLIHACNSGRVLEIPTSLRSLAPEVLFEGDEEGNSLPSIILDSLRKVRKELHQWICACLCLISTKFLLQL